MAVETEIKLRIQPEQSLNIQQHPYIKAHCLDTWQTKTYITTYYDTKAHDLRNQSITLRIRDLGGHYRQTLKLPEEGMVGLAQRQEFEIDIAEPKLNLDVITLPEIKAQLLNHQDQLIPMFQTRFQRTFAILLLSDDTKIEIAIDLGDICCEEKSKPITEVELELISGNVERLFDVALKLSQDLGLVLLFSGKGERGYRLQADSEYKIKKHKMLHLNVDFSIQDAFQNVISHTLKYWQVNDKALRQSNKINAFIHIFDAMNRIKALFDLFQGVIPHKVTRLLRADLNNLIQDLSELNRHYYIHRYFPKVPNGMDIELLLEKLQTVIDSVTYTKLLLDLGLWLISKRWYHYLNENQRKSLDYPIKKLVTKWQNKQLKWLKKLNSKINEMDVHVWYDQYHHFLYVRFIAEWFWNMSSDMCQNAYEILCHMLIELEQLVHLIYIGDITLNKKLYAEIHDKKHHIVAELNDLLPKLIKQMDLA